MADFFQVELGTLSQYVTTLRQAHQQLTDLPRLMSCEDLRLGNGKLDEAAEDFQNSWKHGASQLAELVAETTDAVGVIARVYASADQTIADAVSTLNLAGRS